MNYIGENNKKVDAFDEGSVEERILEFSTEKLDHFLRHQIVWNEITGDIYQLQVGNGTFNIPSGHHVMVGDDVGTVDWIMVDELLTRELDVMTLDMELRNWGSVTPQATDYYTGSVFWPNTKHIIPLQSEHSVILVSEKDQYNQVGSFDVGVFTDAND